MKILHPPHPLVAAASPAAEAAAAPPPHRPRSPSPSPSAWSLETPTVSEQGSCSPGPNASPSQSTNAPDAAAGQPRHARRLLPLRLADIKGLPWQAVASPAPPPAKRPRLGPPPAK